MESKDFCFWLKGILDIKDALNAEETLKVKEKLQTVFEKQTTQTVYDPITKMQTQVIKDSGRSYPYVPVRPRSIC
jgi:hypothetical protein